MDREFFSSTKDEGLCHRKSFRVDCSHQWSTQGSILGPLLFLIFVQDLPDWIKSSIKMFANDTKIWAKIAVWEDANSLQEDLNRLVQWSEKWLLSSTQTNAR